MRDQADVIAFVMAHFKLQIGSSSFESEERVAAFEAAFPHEDSRVELASRFWNHRDQIRKNLTDYVLANKTKIDEQLTLNMDEWLSHVDSLPSSSQSNNRGS